MSTLAVRATVRASAAVCTLKLSLMSAVNVIANNNTSSAAAAVQLFSRILQFPHVFPSVQADV